MASNNTSTTPTERPFNLTENEVNIALHACKLLIQNDGKVDKNDLARAIGKANADTARRTWSQIKHKMGVTAGGVAAGNGAVGPVLTSSKPAAKRKAEAPSKKGSNKRTKKDISEQDGDTEMEEEGV